MYRNTVRELAMFFSEGTREVSVNEFMEFWKPLTEVERDYFRNARL